jgi:hypothetical protein
MKTAIAQYPVIADVEVQPHTTVANPVRQMSRAQVMALVTKGVVVLASVGMMYGVITYGRIFQNYLQW